MTNSLPYPPSESVKFTSDSSSPPSFQYLVCLPLTFCACCSIRASGCFLIRSPPWPKKAVIVCHTETAAVQLSWHHDLGDITHLLPADMRAAISGPWPSPCLFLIIWLLCLIVLTVKLARQQDEKVKVDDWSIILSLRLFFFLVKAKCNFNNNYY